MAENIYTRISDVCREKLNRKNFILISNRGPFTYSIAEEGRLKVRRNNSNLINIFSNLSEYIELTWVTSALSEGDRRTAELEQGKAFKAPLLGQNLYLHFVVTQRNVYHKYYNIICNPLLWFLQHYMWNFSHTPNIDDVVYDAWENGYIKVNQAFAEAAVIEASRNILPPVIMLHDFHLYLAASLIRRDLPNAILHQCIYIPWPSLIYWQLLPMHMRNAIFESLCCNDIIGFQTKHDAYNFLHCCGSLSDNFKVDYNMHTIETDQHKCSVRIYPTSIDVVNIQRMASSASVLEWERRLRPHNGEQSIVCIGRAEPSINILRSLKAFDKFLERYSETLERVRLLALLAPVNTHIRVLQRYMEEVIHLADAINNKYKPSNGTLLRSFMKGIICRR